MPQSSSSGVYKKFTGTYSMSFGYILRAKEISGIPAERRKSFNASKSSKDLSGIIHAQSGSLKCRTIYRYGESNLLPFTLFAKLCS